MAVPVTVERILYAWEVLVALAAVSFFAVAGRHWLRGLAWRRVERRSRTRDGRVVVWGRVESDSEEPVMTVEIDEALRCTVSSNGFHTHLWDETDRRVSARPFTLITPAGERILIDAGASTHFVVPLAPPTDHAEGSRTRKAVLAHGDEVHVVGVASRPPPPGAAYRSPDAAPVDVIIRPPPRRRLIIAAQSLERDDRERASSLAGFGGILLGAATVLLVIQLFEPVWACTLALVSVVPTVALVLGRAADARAPRGWYEGRVVDDTDSR